MKRSEVLRIIEAVLFWNRNVADKDAAMAILDELERQGMAPPNTKRMDPGHFPGDAFEYEIREWDEENSYEATKS